MSPGVVGNALDRLAQGAGCGSFGPGGTCPDIHGAMAWSTNWDHTVGTRSPAPWAPASTGMP